MDESCKGDDQENDQPDKDVPLLPIGNEKDLLPCFIVEGEEALTHSPKRMMVAPERSVK